MKFILSIFILFSLSASCQIRLRPGNLSTKIPQATVQGLTDTIISLRTYISVIDSVNSVIVRSVSDLRATNYQVLSLAKKKSPNDKVYLRLGGYYSPNDGGEGDFFYDDTATAADNGGTVLKPTSVTGNGRWRRIFDRQVNVLWFGAKRDYTDNAYPAIKSAIQAASIANSGEGYGGNSRGVVYIPGGLYKVDSTIKITSQVTVIGEPSLGPVTETRLIFPQNMRGIELQNTSGAVYITLENLWLRSSGTSTDSLAHGIWTNTKVNLKNVNVDNFGGNGFEINTLSATGSGNANNSILFNVSSNYCALNGLYLVGGESNNVGVYSSDFTANGMCGVLDASFLGSAYVNCHVSDNGIRVASGYNKIWTRKGTDFYQSIYFNTTTNKSSHKGINPGVTEGWAGYWYKNTQPPTADTTMIASWSADSTYYITAAYAIVGPSSYSTLTGCYSEGGEGRSILNGGSMAIGGDHGAGFVSRGYIFLQPSSYELMVYGRGLYIPDQDTATTISGFDNQFGLTITDRTAGHNGMQAKYFKGDRTTKFFSANTTDRTSFEILGNAYPGARFGLTGNLNSGLHLPNSGLFMRDAVNGVASRQIFATTAAPTTGEHAAGEFAIYIGTNPAIIGYRCTVSGTPGTWVEVSITPP